jgi:hypothetical protein
LILLHFWHIQNFIINLDTMPFPNKKHPKLNIPPHVVLHCLTSRRTHVHGQRREQNRYFLGNKITTRPYSKRYVNVEEFQNVFYTRHPFWIYKNFMNNNLILLYLQYKYQQNEIQALDKVSRLLEKFTSLFCIIHSSGSAITFRKLIAFLHLEKNPTKT